MYMELIAEILLALFAVFGFYVLIRLFVISHLSVSNMCAAVEIGKDIELEDIPMLIGRVRDRMFLCATGRIIALVDASLAKNGEIVQCLRESGAECYFVQR